MASVGSNPPRDDVSLVMVLMDTNPFFWAVQSPPLTFTLFLEHVLAFFNSILLLHQMNQLVVICTGMNSCELIYDSSNSEYKKNKGIKGQQEHLIASTVIVQQLEDFMTKDQALCKDDNAKMNSHSLLSGSLSMALCYIQRILRGGPSHPQPRILCLQGSPDGPQQYVAVMNAIFSAQRSMVCSGMNLLMPLCNYNNQYASVFESVPIDSCVLGNQHSPFLQQASHITGGIYLKPQQPEGLFQFLAMVFATDLHSRRFLQLPRPTGVDFRASCFCHKKTIDMGYVCSVCLSIFCGTSKRCSTCETQDDQSRHDGAGNLVSLDTFNSNQRPRTILLCNCYKVNL